MGRSNGIGVIKIGDERDSRPKRVRSGYHSKMAKKNKVKKRFTARSTSVYQCKGDCEEVKEGNFADVDRASQLCPNWLNSTNHK